jgi:hypothetical protein
MNHEQLIARFSIFICLKDDLDSAKTMLVQQSNLTLKSLFAELVAENSHKTEEDWARYFLKVLIEAPNLYQFILIKQNNGKIVCLAIVLVMFSHQLLLSYLQLICFYAAQKISDRLHDSDNLKANYTLEDFFAMACEASWQPAKLMRKFDFNCNCSLAGYARTAINNAIQNQIVKDLKIKSFKFSDTGLLRQINPSELEKALRDYGTLAREIVKHRLAWQAFKDLFNELYPPLDSSGQRNDRAFFNSPDREKLALIIERYKCLATRLNLDITTVSALAIQKMLATCIKALRIKQNKKIVSLEKREDLINIVSNCWEELLDEEKQEEFKNLKSIIITEFEALDELSKKTLLLWLGLGINQTDFLALFEFNKQYQVARQFQSYQKKLLINAMRYYHKKYLSQKISEKEVDLVSSDRLENLKAYLTIYSHSIFDSILAKAVKDTIEDTKQSILVDRESLARVTSISSPEKIKLKIELPQIEKQVSSRFIEIIEAQLKIQLKQFNSAEDKIDRFIKHWLQKNVALLN